MCLDQLICRVWFVDLPKAMFSVVMGCLVGIWPCIPFTLAIIGITLVRLPVNTYFTFKVS